MNGNRRNRKERAFPDRTRAEQRADDRRLRAMSHLQRVRGQAPAIRTRPGAVRGGMLLAFATGALLGAILANSAAWLEADPRIAAISVRGAHHLSAGDVADATGVPRGAGFSTVERRVVTERLEEQDWIAEARALPLLTGTLLIDVREISPAGRVSSSESDDDYLVDAFGTPFVIAGAEFESQLPQVGLAGPIEPHEPNAEVALAIELVSDLPRLGLPQSTEVRIAAADDPRGFELTLEGVAPRIVLGSGDFEAKLQNLGRLLASDPERLADATELDLRFADQAVLRNEPLLDEAAPAATVRGDAASSNQPTDRAIRRSNSLGG